MSVWSQAIGLLGADNARESRCLKGQLPRDERIWLQLVGAPSSASPLRAGDAGNGYLASSQAERHERLRLARGRECKTGCDGRKGESLKLGTRRSSGFS